ncbi:MAG: hypothetical protein DWG74_03590 [Chloroflexi bacterium]|nr:hypothetical protein [Chloroflexota bacterium]
MISSAPYRFRFATIPRPLPVHRDSLARGGSVSGGQVKRGPNLASAAAGARVIAVSSVFGDSAAWAAERAIDGDLSTAWSSAGDGDQAFVTVELGDATALTAVGLWTRTMTTSAQIRRFQVVTDGGDVLGPFDVPDATALHVFPVDARARTLRFEVVESSGGNTGVIELAAYGAAAATD